MSSSVEHRGDQNRSSGGPCLPTTRGVTRSPPPEVRPPWLFVARPPRRNSPQHSAPDTVALPAQPGAAGTKLRPSARAALRRRATSHGVLARCSPQRRRHRGHPPPLPGAPGAARGRPARAARGDLPRPRRRAGRRRAPRRRAARGRAARAGAAEPRRRRLLRARRARRGRARCSSAAQRLDPELPDVANNLDAAPGAPPRAPARAPPACRRTVCAALRDARPARPSASPQRARPAEGLTL